MLTSRQIELALAGLIAGGAVFTAMVPGAHSDSSRLDFLSEMRPTVDVSDFERLEMSTATRNVTRDILNSPARSGTTIATFQTSDFEDSAELRFEARPPSSARDDDTIVGSGLGFVVRATAPEGSEMSKWSLVGGAGRETYAITPTSRREMVLVPVAVQSTIGDAHVGVGYEINDRAYATLGYVREDRQFDFGTKDWEEKEHFVGVSVHARW